MRRRGAATVLGLAALASAALLPGPAAAQVCPQCEVDDPLDYGDIPFQWDDGAALPPETAPLPQGFALTVPLARSDLPASLTRYGEVGAALSDCLAGALGADQTRWRDLTLRVSFKRDGTLNGVPRIAHVSAPADAGAAARGREGVLGALTRCTPLPFSPALGAAVAGQVFAIRFIQQRNS